MENKIKPVLQHVQTFLPLFLLDVGSVEGLAFEEFGQFLYWTSYSNSSISRVTIDLQTGLPPPQDKGKDHRILQLDIKDHPRAIVVDVCSG